MKRDRKFYEFLLQVKQIYENLWLQEMNDDISMYSTDEGKSYTPSAE